MHWLIRCLTFVRSARQSGDYARKARGLFGSVRSSTRAVRTLIFRETLDKARQGDARAQLNLGERYYEGRGVPQDYTEAFKWFLSAAQAGHPEAQANLGTMYWLGRGTVKDRVEGYKWIHLAASRNHPAAVRVSIKIEEKMPPELIQEGRRRAEMTGIRRLKEEHGSVRGRC